MTEEEYNAAIEAQTAKYAELDKKYNETVAELTSTKESLKNAIKERDEANSLFMQTQREKITKKNIMEDLK